MDRFDRRSAWIPLLAAVAFGVLAVTSGDLAAQAQQQPMLLQVTFVQLEPETAPQWAELQRNELIPAQKKGGLTWRETWASGVTGDAYTRVIVTQISSLAQYDGQAPIVKALGTEGAQAFGEKNRRLLTGSRSIIIQSRPELGFGTPAAKPNLAILTTVTVANGRAADFESFLKADVIPGLKKGGVGHYTVSRLVYGGDTNQYFTLIPVANYTELAKGHPLERALGADGMARLTQKTAPFVVKLEREIIRFLPDLSFMPSSPTS
jgi:hypothetical protein